MQRSTLGPLALSLSLLFAVACGGSHKRAESPDPTETGWSGPSADGDHASAGPSIQPVAAKSADPAKVLAPRSTSAEPADKPDGISQAEADIIAGRALPPAPKGEKPAKPKKRSAKPRKKSGKSA